MTSQQFYGKDYGTNLFVCEPCDAWVGCHKGTKRPLGRLANRELRYWKKQAHKYFDAKWIKFPKGKSRQRKRSEAYAWLAVQLNIKPKDCHIGMFDVDTCKKVVEACR